MKIGMKLLHHLIFHSECVQDVSESESELDLVAKTKSYSAIWLHVHEKDKVDL